MVDYVEYPTDTLTRIIVPHKPKEPPPGGCFDDSPYDNSYMYSDGNDDPGAGEGEDGGSSTAANVAPLAGSFEMQGGNGPLVLGRYKIYGNSNPANSYGALDAKPHQMTYFMYLDVNDLTFQTDQLNALTPHNTIYWQVPTACGTWITPQGVSDCFNYPNIADIYTVDFKWVPESISCGISISHPRDDGQPMSIPPAPQFAFGPGGAGTFSYKFHYGKWFFRRSGGFTGSFAPYQIDASNEHDPAAGGPIIIWWYTGGGTSGQGASFMGGIVDYDKDRNQVGPGWYSWKVSVHGKSIRDIYIEDGIIPGTLSAEENEWLSTHVMSEPKLRSALDLSVPRAPRRRGLIRA